MDENDNKAQPLTDDEEPEISEVEKHGRCYYHCHPRSCRMRWKGLTKKGKWIVGLLIALGVAIVVADPIPLPKGTLKCESDCFVPDNSAFADLLTKYTTEGSKNGIPLVLVDYTGIKNDPDDLLGQYLDVLRNVELSRLSRDDGQALFINAYNALAINTILENGIPNSINDIGSTFLDPVWDMEAGRVGSLTLSLDDIEHGIIRHYWSDARIHAAVNCASVSCPDLRQEPYEGAQVSDQLDDQTRKWFANTKKGLMPDPEDDEAKVSMIMSWYGEDFDKDGTKQDFIAEYAPSDQIADYMRTQPKLTYFGYDWELNGS